LEIEARYFFYLGGTSNKGYGESSPVAAVPHAATQMDDNAPRHPRMPGRIYEWRGAFMFAEL